MTSQDVLHPVREMKLSKHFCTLFLDLGPQSQIFATYLTVAKSIIESGSVEHPNRQINSVFISKGCRVFFSKYILFK